VRLFYQTSPFYNTAGIYDGVAPNAKLAFIDLSQAGQGLSLPNPISILYTIAYNAGARVHSNSWGSLFSGSGYYAGYDVDLFLYNNPVSKLNQLSLL
jgi:serine protease AprX